MVYAEVLDDNTYDYVLIYFQGCLKRLPMDKCLLYKETVQVNQINVL